MNVYQANVKLRFELCDKITFSVTTLAIRIVLVRKQLIIVHVLE